MKHLELFAGIGGFRQAMNLLQKDKIMNFDCVGYSEIDTNAKKTYKVNYNPSDSEMDIGEQERF